MPWFVNWKVDKYVATIVQLELKFTPHVSILKDTAVNQQANQDEWKKYTAEEYSTFDIWQVH